MSLLLSDSNKLWDCSNSAHAGVASERAYHAPRSAHKLSVKEKSFFQNLVTAAAKQTAGGGRPSRNDVLLFVDSSAERRNPREPLLLLLLLTYISAPSPPPKFRSNQHRS